MAQEQEVNLFLVKASPSVDGVGAMIMDELKTFLVEYQTPSKVMIYDQTFENVNPVYKRANLNQFNESGTVDITPFEKDISDSDGIIIICPVYLHQVPGTFKNTLDSFSYRAHEFPLLGKKVVIFAYGISNGSDDLAKYLQMIFTSMGAEIVTVQSCFLVNGKLDEDVAILKENIGRMMERVVNNQYAVTRKQEQLFQYYKNIVLEELKEGVVSSKQKRWKELLLYEDLVSYLEKSQTR